MPTTSTRKRPLRARALKGLTPADLKDLPTIDTDAVVLAVAEVRRYAHRLGIQIPFDINVFRGADWPIDLNEYLMVDRGRSSAEADKMLTDWRNNWSELRRELKAAAGVGAIPKQARRGRGKPRTFDPLQDDRLLKDCKASEMTRRQYENKRGLPGGTVRAAADRVRHRTP